MSIFRTKNLHQLTEETKSKSLKKTLGTIDLSLLGIGCIIGTGIFVLTGIAAAEHAGPGISISYLLSAIVCMFAAFAYAELASMVSATGSAYIYTYVALGEIVAWMVGWGLVLEYALGSATVAAGWSGYLVGILKSGGIHLPDAITKIPGQGGIINLPAVLISSFIGWLLVRGTKESIITNRILVVTKLSVIILFLVIATPSVKTENWSNFMPFGWSGILTGAAIIFFAYVGFDSVATAAEECKDPKRSVPIGIIVALSVSAILYIAVALVLTGIVPYTTLNNSEPVAQALRDNGKNIGSMLVAVGAMAGMTSVLLVFIYGQSRIAFVMSRDGLISKSFQKIHPRFNTPYVSIVVVTIFIAVLSGFVSLQTLSHLTSLGTLLAFMVVAVGVLVMRRTHSEFERPFKCPAVWFVAPVAILSCSYLIYSLLLEAGKPFLLWMVLGLVIYCVYGYKNSTLNKSSKKEEDGDEGLSRVVVAAE